MVKVTVGKIGVLAVAMAAMATGFTGCTSDDEASPPDPVTDAGPDRTQPPPPADLDAGRDSGLPPLGDGSTGFGRIEGQLLDFDALELGIRSGLQVRVGAQTLTVDDNGHFAFDQVPAGLQFVEIVGTAAGPTTGRSNTPPSEVPVFVTKDATTQTFPRIADGCAGHVTVEDGGTEDGGVGVGVSAATCHTQRAAVFFRATLPGTGLTRGGSPYSGQVALQMVPVAFPGAPGSPSLDGVSTLPGDFVGKSSADAGTPVEVLGAASVRAYDDQGQALAVAAGQKVRLQVQTFRAAAVGEVFRAWRYDSAQHLWLEGPQGTFGTGQTESGATVPVFTTDVPAFGTWAVARAVTTRTCIRGTVAYADGTKAAFAEVRSIGLDHGAAAVVNANAAGVFCTDVLPPAAAGGGANVVVRATSFASAGARARGEKSVTAGTTARSCISDPAACTDVGVVTLGLVNSVCVHGRLTVANVDGGTDVGIEGDAVQLIAEIGARLSTAQLESGKVDRANVGVVRPRGGSYCLGLPPAPSYQVRSTVPCTGSTDTFPLTGFEVTDLDAGPGLCVVPEGGTATAPASGCVDVGERLLSCPQG